MRFACPHCNKVLLVKDAYAGKTGKCPECGNRITLPEQGDSTETEESSPESRAQLEADSSRFAQETEPPKAPEKGSRKFHPAIAVLAGLLVLAAAAGAGYWYWSAPARIPVPVLSMYNVDADRYVKRSVALDAEKIQRWQTALKEATGEYHTSKEVFFLLPNIDGLWQQDTWRETASERYLQRIATTPLHVLRDWRTEIQRASGGAAGATLSDVLTRLVEIDRLYDDPQLDMKDSDLLLSRLQDLPVDSVADWADALQGEKGQAALSLAMMDPLFTDGRFDTDRFQKKLRWIQNR